MNPGSFSLDLRTEYPVIRQPGRPDAIVEMFPELLFGNEKSKPKKARS